MYKLDLFAHLTWNPPREAFTVPFLDHPIVWYGILFAIGFICAYFFALKMYRRYFSTAAIDVGSVEHWDRLVGELNNAGKSPIHPIHSYIKSWDAQDRKRLQQLVGKVLDSQDKQWLIDQLSRHDPNDLRLYISDSLFKGDEIASYFTDKIAWFMVIGTIVGARLGHVVFYSWDYYKDNLFDILKTWEGGLASHGGVIGIVLSLIAFNWWMGRKGFSSIPKLVSWDIIATVAPLAGFFIRLGNFFNQELIGTRTQVPWGVVFGKPVEGKPGIAYHPVQLYEAFAYLFIFWYMYRLFKKGRAYLGSGKLTGLFFFLVFTARFFLEFFKQYQPTSLLPEGFPIQMGQVLSIPCVLIGLVLLVRSRWLR